MDESSTSSKTRRFLREPSELAWSDFVDRYGPRLLAWGRKKELDHQACEDVAQDVLVRLHKYMHSYDREKSFRGWLYKITENAALDYIKSQKKLGTALPPGFEEYAVGSGGIAEFVANQDIVTVATERVRIQVGSKEWDAYELHELKHRSYTDISKQLEITEPTATNYVSKVRKMLGAELKRLDADGDRA